MVIITIQFHAPNNKCVCVCVLCVFREKIRDIEELRRAVKQEAGELERQLKELAYEYDESLKMVTHLMKTKFIS